MRLVHPLKLTKPVQRQYTYVKANQVQAALMEKVEPSNSPSRIVLIGYVEMIGKRGCVCSIYYSKNSGGRS